MRKYISTDLIKDLMKNNRLFQGNCEYELWKQEVEKFVDNLPCYEVDKVYKQGWNDAIDAMQNAKFASLGSRCGTCRWNTWDNNCIIEYRGCYYEPKAEPTEPSNSEKPNNCDTCRNKGFEGCEQPCLGCGCCGLYEPKTEPQTDCAWK